MIHLNAAEIRRTLRGAWLRVPRDDLAVCGVSTDSRAVTPGSAFVALRGESHDGHAFIREAAEAGAAMVIVDRDSAATAECFVPVLRISDSQHGLIDLARAWRSRLERAKVVAITGSAGKTTTKTILHSLCATERCGVAAPRSFNNSIGVPLTLLGAAADAEFVICELGTNAPGEIASLAAIVQPDIAIITCIGRSHLEGLGSLRGVAAEKSSLLDALRSDGLAIVADTPAELGERAAGRRLRVKRFGVHHDAQLRLTDRGVTDEHVAWFEVNGSERFETTLHGTHNALNCIAAIAAARAIGISDASIRDSLRTLAPAAMRGERIRRGGIDIFNDAYNANPESMRAALETFAELTPFARSRTVILGDMLELGRESEALHEELGAMLRAVVFEQPLHRAVLIGRYADAVYRGMEDAIAPHGVRVVRELDDSTLNEIASIFEPGDAVLVKGSRGMRLERIAERIGTEVAAAATGAVA